MNSESNPYHPEGLRSQEYSEFVEPHIHDEAIASTGQRIFSRAEFEGRFGTIFWVEDEGAVSEANLSDIEVVSEYFSEKYVPRMAVDENTMCEAHFGKGAAIDLKEPSALPIFQELEIDVSCCAECDNKRVEAWGRPDEEYIGYFAAGLLKVKSENPERYEYTIQEFRLFAYAELTDEKEGIAERVLSQVEECAQSQLVEDEDDKVPYWTADDYDSLLDVLGE